MDPISELMNLGSFHCILHNRTQQILWNVCDFGFDVLDFDTCTEKSPELLNPVTGHDPIWRWCGVEKSVAMHFLFLVQYGP